jgi:hypothetical protein
VFIIADAAETDGPDLVAVKTEAMGILVALGIHAPSSFFSASHPKGQRYDPEQGERDHSAQGPGKVLLPSVEARPVHDSTVGQASGEVKGSGVPPFLMGIG